MLQTGIWNAYTKLGCDVPDNREIVGEDGITTRNMMTVLSLLEQRSTKVLQVRKRACSERVAGAGTAGATTDIRADKALAYSSCLRFKAGCSRLMDADVSFTDPRA